MVLGSTRLGAVAVLTLHRPQVRNALSVELCRAIHAGVDEAIAAQARVIVITGEGTAFCSGADLNGVYGDDFQRALYGMLNRLVEVPVPIIAAVNGPAIGGGTQLAIACDLRVVDASAQFGVPTVRNGLAVDGWTIRRLADLAGGGMARRLMLAGEVVDADAALQSGLADRRGTLIDALAWADEIAELAPLSIAHSKRVFAGADDDTIAKSLVEVWASQDAREAATARAEKRPPRFQGR